MIFGFCATSKTDAMLDANGDCAQHGTLCTPPTWGDRRWRWAAGTWTPYKHRPRGHAWVQPTDDGPKPARTGSPIDVTRPYPASYGRRPPTDGYTPPRTVTCARCGKDFVSTARVGAVYCRRPCRRPVRAFGPTIRPCRACGADVPQPASGGAKLDCDRRCTRQWTLRQSAGTPCRVCGRTGLQIVSGGRCDTCRRRGRSAPEVT